MSISGVLICFAIAPAVIATAVLIVWAACTILDLDLDTSDKCFLVFLTTFIEGLSTFVLLSAAYGKP